jgi:hypothetical protein
MYEIKRIYITVKTYPVISKKFAEIVCTAGIAEKGEWIRLFPIPFRKLRDDKQYPKYTWIEVSVEKHTNDIRPESFRPDIETMIIEEKPHITDWENRRNIILSNTKIYPNLTELIDASHHPTNVSLAVFKPNKIHGLIITRTKNEWNQKKLKKTSRSSQKSLTNSHTNLKMTKADCLHS